jgi:hypothetical protein
VDLGISKLGELYDLSVALANWYFNSDGGLIMSERTKKCYINTQETIEQILLDAMGENTAVISRQKIVDTPLKREKYLKTQKKFSTLRTAMTKDLLTRRKSFF